MGSTMHVRGLILKEKASLEITAWIHHHGDGLATAKYVYFAWGQLEKGGEPAFAHAPL